MSGFWLISFVVLWILVVSLALVILAMAKEIESLHTKLDSLSHMLGSSRYGVTNKSNQQIVSAAEGKTM